MMVLAQALPDIAPPVSYSLVPPWVVVVASLIPLPIIGPAIRYGRRFFRKKEVALSPRERALAALNGIATEVEEILPYQLRVRVPEILRRSVMDQFGLGIARQTAVEF